MLKINRRDFLAAFTAGIAAAMVPTLGLTAPKTEAIIPISQVKGHQRLSGIVSFEQFISDPQYLGNTLNNPNGESLLYPIWRENIEEIHAADCTVVDVNCSRAAGFTTASMVAVLYDVHREIENPSSTGPSFIFLSDMGTVFSRMIIAKQFKDWIQTSPYFSKRLRAHHNNYFTLNHVDIYTGSIGMYRNQRGMHVVGGVVEILQMNEYNTRNLGELLGRHALHETKYPIWFNGIQNNIALNPHLNTYDLKVLTEDTRKFS